MRFYKSNFTYLTVAVLLFVLVASCGKKTDPVALSQAVPSPASNLRIFNNNEGVVIRNNDKKFPFSVQRAVFDPECGCLTDYSKGTTINPLSVFIDDNVTEDVRYVYSITALHPVYKNRSQPVKKAVVYAKPVVITDVKILELPGDRFSFDVTTNEPFERIEIFSGGALEQRTSRNTFEINMNGKEDRTITLYPFDKFGNAGEEKIIALVVKEKVPDAPFGFKSVYGGGVLTLSWDEPAGAWLYNVYMKKDGVYSFLGKVDVPYFMYSVGRDTTDCRYFAVSSAIDGGESVKEEYRACWP